jgi:hypothetical protein
MKKGNTNLALFMLVFLLGCAIQLPIHEYGHYVVGRAFGLDGTILFDRVVFTSIPASVTFEQILLIKLAGGVIAGVALLVLAAISKRPYGYGFLPVAAASFAYAPLDGSGWSGSLLFAIILAGAFTAIILYLEHTGKFDDELTAAHKLPFEARKEKP